MRPRLRRGWIGLALLGAFVAVSHLREARLALVTYRGVERPDEISRYEARFRGLRGVVPSHGVIGYLSDAPPVAMADPASVEARQSFKRYLLTQYALVPLVVLRGPDAELVVGNFSAPRSAAGATPPGFVVIRDFGDGVTLLRRSAN